MAPKKNLNEKEIEVGIDFDGDGNIDGFYKTKKSQLQKQAKKTQGEMKIPKTIELISQRKISVSVKYVLDETKEIVFGLEGELMPGESIAAGHKRLYLACLNSIKENT